MLDLTRVSVDDFVPNLGKAVATDLVGEKAWLSAYVDAMNVTEQLLGGRRSVIFDSVGHTRKNRYRLRRLAEGHDAEFGIVWLRTSRTEALARLTSNEAAPVRPSVPVESFLTIADQFEAPQSDEPFVTYDPTFDLSTWIETDLRAFISR
jgi:predicted kinase